MFNYSTFLSSTKTHSTLLARDRKELGVYLPGGVTVHRLRDKVTGDCDTVFLKLFSPNIHHGV
jgi:hypothetical protein